jgi:hypothetical protein
MGSMIQGWANNLWLKMRLVTTLERSAPTKMQREDNECINCMQFNDYALC